MGSFPIFLKFDSLGRQLYKYIIYIVYLPKIYFSFFFFKQSPNYFFNKQLKKNSFNFFFKNSFNIFFFRILKTKAFVSLGIILSNLFKLHKNVLFLDFHENFNYLPFCNNTLFNRSLNNFFKKLIFYNISLVFFFKLKKKSFFLRRYHKDVISVGVSKNYFDKKLDIVLDLPDTDIYHYCIYLYTMNLYLLYK